MRLFHFYCLITLLSVVCELASPATRGTEEGNTLADLLQEAFDSYQAGNIAQSISRLKQANDMAPNRPEILDLLGMTHLDGKMPDEALDYYEKKLSLLPPTEVKDIAQTHYSVGVAHAKLRQHQKAIESYRESLKFQADNSDAHCNLGIALSDLEQIEEAKSHLHTALLLNPDDGYAVHELSLIDKQEKQNQLIEKLEQEHFNKKLKVDFDSYWKIEKRRGLSFTDFISQHEMNSLPVVLTDVASGMVPKPWDYDYILQHCSQARVTPKQKSKTPGEKWANLVESQQTTLDQFIKDANLSGSSLYVHDYSLPLNCPSLLKELRIPEYFSHDLLQHLPDTVKGVPVPYKNSWPSLFIGPKGTMSGLHVDSLCTHFWMALFKGRKKWIFYKKSSLPYLYFDWKKATFKADPLTPDHQLFPLLMHAQAAEVVLEPGEVIFVPARVPHLVVNLEDTVAVSANYVDQVNYDCTCDELKVSGKRHKSKHLLHSELCSNVFREDHKKQLEQKRIVLERS